MPKHDFGILPAAPRQGKRYDAYEPQKYACISVDDACIAGIAEKLMSFDSYRSTLSVKGRGLAYCGITLIPPSSLNAFIRSIGDDICLSPLKNLLETGLTEGKWVIHYGI